MLEVRGADQRAQDHGLQFSMVCEYIELSQYALGVWKSCLYQPALLPLLNLHAVYPGPNCLS